MITVAQIPSWYWTSIGVLNLCVNERGSLILNLWEIWGRDINPYVIFVYSQCIILEVSCHQTTVYVAAVYASTSYSTRHQLWHDLTLMLGRYHGPWFFLGDFNVVLGAHEKRGCQTPPSTSCMDFLHWSNANLLSHLPSFSSFFT